MTAAVVFRSWMDQLDQDTTLGGPDLEVEVSEGGHSYQSVDVLMPEREHSEREVRRRYAQHGELGHANPEALLLAHRGVDLGPLEAVSLGVTDPLDQLWHERGRSCPGVQHESCFRRS